MSCRYVTKESEILSRSWSGPNIFQLLYSPFTGAYRCSLFEATSLSVPLVSVSCTPEHQAAESRLGHSVGVLSHVVIIRLRDFVSSRMGTEMSILEDTGHFVCRRVYSNCDVLLEMFWTSFVSVLGWGAILRAGRSRVRFPIRSLDFSVDVILLAALCPWS
jgi:hypothetical protein